MRRRKRCYQCNKFIVKLYSAHLAYKDTPMRRVFLCGPECLGRLSYISSLQQQKVQP